MAIPKETYKELIMTVENDQIEVVISPPVLDALVLVGHPPPVDSRTMYFDHYRDDILVLRTASGLTFEVDNVGAGTVTIQEQVEIRLDPPPYDGQVNNEIVISTSDRTIRYWTGATSDWPNPQVLIGTGAPSTATVGQVYINTASRSILEFV